MVGAVNNRGALIAPFIRPYRRKMSGQGEGGSGGETSMVPVTENENMKGQAS
jgi:hypothetical protein